MVVSTPTKTLLWLYDIRNPHKGDWLSNYAPEYVNGTVVWVKNYDDFVEWIEVNGLPEMISFDHDLGEDLAMDLVSNGVNKKVARTIKRDSKSGYDAAKWLVDDSIDNDMDLPMFGVHSANPVGAENIRRLLTNYMKQR